jgi:hypothetical protein
MHDINSRIILRSLSVSFRKSRVEYLADTSRLFPKFKQVSLFTIRPLIGEMMRREHLVDPI